MSAEQNMALARRFLEAFANGDLDTLDESPSCTQFREQRTRARNR